jgi:hypothetical protein
MIRIVINEEGRRKLKKKYNSLLVRYNKAVSYMNDNNVPIKDKEKHLPSYVQILKDMNLIIWVLELVGEEVEASILDGFTV